MEESHYLGVKQVKATPQERDGVPGYKVVYEGGYESWSPKDPFEAAYVRMGYNGWFLTSEEGQEFKTKILMALGYNKEESAAMEHHEFLATIGIPA